MGQRLWGYEPQPSSRVNDTNASIEHTHTDVADTDFDGDSTYTGVGETDTSSVNAPATVNIHVDIVRPPCRHYSRSTVTTTGRNRPLEDFVRGSIDALYSYYAKDGNQQRYNNADFAKWAYNSVTDRATEEMKEGRGHFYGLQEGQSIKCQVKTRTEGECLDAGRSDTTTCESTCEREHDGFTPLRFGEGMLTNPRRRRLYLSRRDT